MPAYTNIAVEVALFGRENYERFRALCQPHSAAIGKHGQRTTPNFSGAETSQKLRDRRRSRSRKPPSIIVRSSFERSAAVFRKKSHENCDKFTLTFTTTEITTPLYDNNNNNAAASREQPTGSQPQQNRRYPSGRSVTTTPFSRAFRVTRIQILFRVGCSSLLPPTASRPGQGHKGGCAWRRVESLETVAPTRSSAIADNHVTSQARVFRLPKL